MQQSFCSNCGAAITADSKFCGLCGAAIHAPTSPVTSTAQVQVQAEENRDASFLDSTLNVLVGPLKNGFVFFAIYFIFMLPTYYLPYVGSNSALLNVATSAVGLGLSPQFWAHVACLFVLVVVTWLRGCVIRKQWITVFPVIAGLFDLTPGLSIIPFVPTVMHVIALIMGVRGTEKDTSNVRVPVLGAAVSAVGAFVVVSGLLYSWAWPSRLESLQQPTAPSMATTAPTPTTVPVAPVKPPRPDGVFQPVHAAFMQQDIATVATDPDARAIGKNLFLTYCSQCHGSDAAGARGYPNLTDGDWLYGGDPDTIKASITDGRVGVMPALGDALGADGTKQVSNYVLSLSGRPHDAALASAGRPKFEENCAACHMPDGTGMQAMGAPNLTDKVWLYGGSESAIIDVIAKGRNGVMLAMAQTLGTTSNKDAKLHLLTAYVYSLSQKQ